MTNFSEGFGALPSGGFENPHLFAKMNGYSNGSPFQVGWNANNVTFSRDANHCPVMGLTLDDTPIAGQPYSSGEVQTVAIYGYGTLSAYIKPAKASGVVTGLFMYAGIYGQPNHHEVDIEFLGADTTKVQFNYYVAGVGGHEYTCELGFDASQTWAKYSVEWTATGIVWRVNERIVHQVSGVMPQPPAKVMMNLWTGNIPEWMGVLSYSVPLTSQFKHLSFVAGSNSSSSSFAPTGDNYSAEFYRNGGPVSIVDNAFTINNYNGNLASAYMQISNLLDGTNETIAVATVGTNISASYSNGLLALSGSDSVANYEQVIRTATYNNTALIPDLSDRAIQLVVSNGSESVNIGSSTVSLNMSVVELGTVVPDTEYERESLTLLSSELDILYSFRIPPNTSIHGSVNIVDSEGNDLDMSSLGVGEGMGMQLLDADGTVLATAPLVNRSLHFEVQYPAFSPGQKYVRIYQLLPGQPTMYYFMIIGFPLGLRWGNG